MSYNIKDEADIVAATVGVEVHEIGQHPSGAYVLHTSVGKGYLPDDIGFDSSREALVEALGTTLQLMKDIADGAFDPYVHTDDSGKQDDEPAPSAEVGAEVAPGVFAEAGSVEEQLFSAEPSELVLEPGSVEDDVAAMSIVAPEDAPKPKRGRKPKATKNEGAGDLEAEESEPSS